MRIYVVEPDGAGGLLHYAFQMCEGLSRAGADVTLVTGVHFELADTERTFDVEPRIRLWKAAGSSLPDGRVASLLVRLGRKARRAVRALRYSWEWWRLTSYLIRENPDVIQFSAIRFPFQAVFLRRLARRGLTLTQVCHEFEPRELGRVASWLHDRGSRTVYDSFDLIYLHGTSNRERFHELFPMPRERTRSIPHGNEQLIVDQAGQVETHAARRTPTSDSPTALFFGGLRPSKGLDVLIAAWELVRYEVDARLRICGEPEGVDPAALRALIEETGVTVSVDLDPTYQPLDRVAELMADATLVVLPYHSATASGVLQVAYAFGVPVVATSVGALTEDIDVGETGLLVPPGNPEALARALIKLLTDPAEASRMGENARAAVSRFDWNDIARSILADYEAVA